MKKTQLRVTYILVVIIILSVLTYSFIPKNKSLDSEDILSFNNHDLDQLMEIGSSQEENIPTASNCPSQINYLYQNYTAYALSIKSELEENIGLELIGKAYGGNDGVENKRECGKVYFIMFKPGEWNSYKYWAVEVNAETSELLKWEEVTFEDNEIDYSKIWWIE